METTKQGYFIEFASKDTGERTIKDIVVFYAKSPQEIIDYSITCVDLYNSTNKPINIGVCISVYDINANFLHSVSFSVLRSNYFLRAGRKAKYNEQTRVLSVRVPASKYDDCKQLVLDFISH